MLSHHHNVTSTYDNKNCPNFQLYISKGSCPNINYIIMIQNQSY